MAGKRPAGRSWIDAWYFLTSYWWLMFPVGAFVFGAWDRWLAYRRSRDHLDLIKTYAAQGKEVPPELMQQVRDEASGVPPGYPPGGPDYGGYGYWGHPRYMRRAWRGYYRWGPDWQWRSVFVTGAIAAGFWWASMDGGLAGHHGPVPAGGDHPDPWSARAIC